MYEQPDNAHRSVEERVHILRAAVLDRLGSVETVGWETEEFLRHRQRIRQVVSEWLRPESIAAEVETRDDTPRLLDALLEAMTTP